MKKEQPVAICMKCGEYSRSLGHINEKCSNYIDGKQCRGTFKSVLNNNDWKECQKCSGFGNINKQKCISCNGEGWLYMR